MNREETLTKLRGLRASNLAFVEGLPCKISVLTEIDGTKSLFSKTGGMRLSEGGEVALSYASETDEGTFFIGNNHAEWHRSGEVYAHLTFETGAVTKGEFGAQGLNGEALIETDSIDLKIKKDFIAAEIVYTMRFDCGEQKTTVKLRARLVEETSRIVC